MTDAIHNSRTISQAYSDYNFANPETSPERISSLDLKIMLGCAAPLVMMALQADSPEAILFMLCVAAIATFGSWFGKKVMSNRLDRKCSTLRTLRALANERVHAINAVEHYVWPRWPDELTKPEKVEHIEYLDDQHRKIANFHLGVTLAAVGFFVREPVELIPVLGAMGLMYAINSVHPKYPPRR